MASFVRIKAMPTVDNTDEFPLYMDVVLDDANRLSGNYPIFGFQGEIGQKSGASMPFILHPDGRLDFGEKYNHAADRFFHLELRDATIYEGQLLRIHGEGYDAAFRITALTPLF
jgi:hypothetical protein